MELYFKDLEDEAAAAAGDLCICEDAGAGDSEAEDRAFAELSERVSAARLVY